MSDPKFLLDETIRRQPVLTGLRERMLIAFETLRFTFTAGGKLLACGNGGSSADADHVVNELMKEFRKKRPLPEQIRQRILDRYGAEKVYLVENLQGGLPALSLASHTAFLTAFANDANADFIFAQQAYTLGRAGDCLLAISTSGNSANVYYAAMVAQSIGIKVIGLTGRTGGRLVSFCDVLLNVPEEETGKAQMLPQVVYHTLCGMVEEDFL